jgi:Flp pilus assembly protein TadG
MNLHVITSRPRNDSGQAAIEFALVVPLLIAFLFLVAGFGRAFNAYNDLNQMAADGARLAAVGNFPSDLVAKNADTPATRIATITGPTYSSGTCVVGATVKVTARADVGLIPYVPYIAPTTLPLKGTSEMRVERCP